MGICGSRQNWILNNRLDEPIKNCLEGSLIDGIVKKDYFIKFYPIVIIEKSTQLGYGN